MDPGMRPATIEIDEADLEKTLRAEALKMNYTRAHVKREGARLLRWSTAKGVTFVRALGTQEWKDWATMDSMERHKWKEQDRG